MHNISNTFMQQNSFPFLQYCPTINVNVNLATTKIDLQTRIYRLIDTTKTAHHLHMAHFILSQTYWVGRILLDIPFPTKD